MRKQLPLLRERIAYNGVYKAVAFFVALSIWVTTLNGNREVLMTRDVQVKFILNSNLKIANGQTSVHMKVAGLRGFLKKINWNSQNVTLNIANLEAGVHQIPLQPADLSLPSGVRLISVEPAKLLLELQEVKSEKK